MHKYIKGDKMEQNTTATMPVMDSGKQNSGKGLKIATAIASVVAVCGIGFGVYGMVQSSQKDNQISDLKVQIEDSNGKITTLETDEIKVSDDSQTITISDSVTKKQNPVISATAPKRYNLSFDSPRFPIGSNDYYVKLGIVDGSISSCGLYVHTIDWVGYDAIEKNKFEKDCDGINGISGKIYKAAIAGEGQDSSLSNVAFIMENGTVSYIPTEELVRGVVDNGVATIKGTLGIDGFVVDAFTVGVGEEGAGGGYATTIFVLSDGTYIKYDDSMLN